MLRAALRAGGLLVLVAGCRTASDTPEDTDDAPSTADTDLAESDADTDEPAPTEIGEDHEDADDATWEEGEVVFIHLADGATTVDGDGVTIDGDLVTITAPGTYQVDGRLSDGRLVVQSEGDGLVRLLLDGAQITSGDGSALAVMQADRTAIVLLDGTESRLTDAATYVFADGTDEPDAALFSADDLSIYGPGGLTVTGRYGDAVVSKDGLVIAGGTLTVTAADDGIRGKDYLIVRGGTIGVTATGDGLKSDEEEDAALGRVQIEGGITSVDAGGDGVDAFTTFQMSAGELTVVSGGGSRRSVDGSKGIKAGALLRIEGGSLDVDSAEDALHSNDALEIAGGDSILAAADDGLHADVALTVSGGSVDLTTSYEGMEAQFITVSGGEVSLASSDDGVNAAGDCAGGGGGRPGGPGGGGGGGGGGTCSITVSGGLLVVHADGDGIDANGSVSMTAGTVLVHGPTARNNGALDYDGSFPIAGGLLIAAGSNGIAQAPDTSSAQASVLMTFGSSQPAGTLVHVETADGATLFTFAPEKAFQTIAFSSPLLTVGERIVVSRGGSTTGTLSGGLAAGGTYSGGTEVGRFNLSGVVTTRQL